MYTRKYIVSQGGRLLSRTERRINNSRFNLGIIGRTCFVVDHHSVQLQRRRYGALLLLHTHKNNNNHHAITKNNTNNKKNLIAISAVSMTMSYYSMNKHNSSTTSSTTKNTIMNNFLGSNNPLNMRMRMSMSMSMSTSASASDYTADNVTHIIPEEVEKVRQQQQQTQAGANASSYLIFDVREEHELADNNHLDGGDWVHIPQAKFFAIDDCPALEAMLQRDYSIELSQFQELYFLCRSGRRSDNVAKHLLDIDVKQKLFNIAGGILRYKEDVLEK